MAQKRYSRCADVVENKSLQEVLLRVKDGTHLNNQELPPNPIQSWDLVIAT